VLGFGMVAKGGGGAGKVRELFFHYSSLRSYLVEEHGMEEWQAERKIRAARLLIRFPLLEMKIQSGKMNLTLMELAQGCAHREKLGELIDVLATEYRERHHPEEKAKRAQERKHVVGAAGDSNRKSSNFLTV